MPRIEIEDICEQPLGLSTPLAPYPPLVTGGPRIHCLDADEVAGTYPWVPLVD